MVKKLVLCHFANDVRIDFEENNTWSYQNNIDDKLPTYLQFLYTNSNQQINYIDRMLFTYGASNPMMKGYLSAIKDPLFVGHRVNFYDAVIQGHVHWKIYEKSPSTVFYSIRAVGMAYNQDSIETASYVILTETEKGYDFEEVLVKYDREKMEYSILNSDMLDNSIYNFVNLNSPSR